MSISTTTATGTLGSAPAAEPRAGLVNKTRNALRAITHSPRMLSGTIILVVFVLVAIFGPQFAHNPNAFVGPALKGPSAKFWLGTTQTGQSVFTQLILSTRSTLEVGFAAGLLATVVALAIGVGGAFGGGSAGPWQGAGGVPAGPAAGSRRSRPPRKNARWRTCRGSR